MQGTIAHLRRPPAKTDKGFFILLDAIIRNSGSKSPEPSRLSWLRQSTLKSKRRQFNPKKGSKDQIEAVRKQNRRIAVRVVATYK